MVFKKTSMLVLGGLAAIAAANATPASAAPAANGVTMGDSALVHKATWDGRRHYGWRGYDRDWRGYGWRGRHYGWRHRGLRGNHYGWRHRGWRKHYGWRGW